MGACCITPGPKPLYSGAVEVSAAPGSGIAVTDRPCDAIRWIVHEGTRPGMNNTAAQRINTLRSNGIFPVLCLGDGGYSSAANLANDTWDILNQVNNPEGLWMEMINEPGQDTNTPAVNRSNYLARIFGLSTGGGTRWSGSKCALDVAHLFGVKTLCSAITGVSGGLGPTLTDIDNGVSGASHAKLDGFALHQYDQTASDVITNYTQRRADIDSHEGSRHKPVMMTEIGWMCSTRADGSDPGDWVPGASQWMTVSQTITLAQQANRISDGAGGGLWEKIILHPEFLCLGIFWFGHKDYGIPTGQHYNHTGLKDFGDGKRTSWGRLAAQPAILAVNHFHA